MRLDLKSNEVLFDMLRADRASPRMRARIGHELDRRKNNG